MTASFASKTERMTKVSAVGACVQTVEKKSAQSRVEITAAMDCNFIA
jgi:hypothetical protein